MVFQFFFQAALGVALGVALAAFVFLWAYQRVSTRRARR